MSQANSPRAVIHKRILDVAEQNPNASIETIANQISGANLGLVEKVITDYGDPAEPDESETAPVFSPEELTERQCEILQTIGRNPEASQREIATMLDITAPTVSRHLNKIPGWDWERRGEFADEISEKISRIDGEDSATESAESTESAETDSATASTESSEPAETASTEAETPDRDAEDPSLPKPASAVIAVEETSDLPDMSTDGAGRDQPELSQLIDRVDELEKQLEAVDADDSGLVLDDPELIQKIIHTCMDAESISQDEELHIIESLVT